MALIAIGRAWQDVTIAAASIVKIFKGPIYVAPAGTQADGAGYKIGDQFPAAAGTVLAFRGPGYIETDPFPVPAGVPAAFAASGWSIATGVGLATITITTIPALNGGTLQGIDYQVGSGPWQALVRTTAGTETITLAAGAHNVRIAARTAAGRGLASAVKAVTVT